MLSDDAHLFTEVKKNHIYLSCQVIGNSSILKCDDFPKVYINVIKLETKLYIGLLFIMYLSDGNTRNNNTSKSDTTFNDLATVFELYFTHMGDLMWWTDLPCERMGLKELS